MGKIDLSINKVGLAHNIQKAKENNVIIPTIAQMQNPDLIPEKIKAKLSHTGLWDVDPVNLFRISWHNEAKESGGLFQAVPNYVEIPSKLSGVPCRIIAMSGKWFPTGCHKVGASFGCLAPRLVTGQFDATYHHAVWPSTGNYCRGGAFNSKLLACESVAILPQDMSKERFDWLKSIAGQIIATPGCESNVKEIFDKTWELKQDPTMMIFNQFAEMGNPLWHYNVTGYALADLFEAIKKPGQSFAGACFTSGSAGTMSAGDLLKERYPHLKLAVGEALQCPTILDNGFGGHRIEGIGDKHIPWIHNVKNTDMAIAIDDEDSQRLLRLFNTEDGKAYMKNELGMSDEEIEKMSWLGISGIANVLCCIKMAKYYELTENDVVGTVLTDSAAMYQSRVDELNQQHGAYNAHEAAMDHARHMLDLKTDSMLELTYTERKRVHNLKYYTWVEQQGMTVEDLNAQWYDTKGTWDAVHKQAAELDEYKYVDETFRQIFKNREPTSMSRVKLRDIADYTGTAISTVSAALNGTGRVSPDKAKQIREAAEKLGFKPNLAAQLLKNHEVDIFGLIISDRLTRLTGHGVYSELQEKFLNECRAGKIRTQFELDRTGGVPATFSDGIAKGVIHAGVISEPLRDWLERNPAYPFVSFEEPWKYCVRTDFETGVRKAVQYLAATGHHRIGLFCGPAQFDLSKQMEAGFREGCKEFGREIRPELIRRHSLAVGRDHFLECAQHVREFFSGPVKPDAIIAPGQGFCTVALYELPRLGVRVPEDVSLIGACSGWEAERVYPQLTSIERNIELLVANAMKMLRQLTRGIAPENPNQLIPADLVVRDTVVSRFQ